MEALTEKVRFPSVTDGDLGIVHRFLTVDLNGREGIYQVNKSEMYFGAI